MAGAFVRSTIATCSLANLSSWLPPSPRSPRSRSPKLPMCLVALYDHCELIVGSVQTFKQRSNREGSCRPRSRRQCDERNGNDCQDYPRQL